MHHKKSHSIGYLDESERKQLEQASLKANTLHVPVVKNVKNNNDRKSMPNLLTIPDNIKNTNNSGRSSPLTPLSLSRSASITIKTDKASHIKARNDEIKKYKAIKDVINMVVLGHVDAGKSTLMGQLLVQLGYVDQRQLHKYKKEAQLLNKASFIYAWILDQQNEERERGVTVDIATSYFETKTKYVTLIDAPGHRDFIPNMINGTSQADCGILVIPAIWNEFQDGFQDGGQTKEHAILARALGVNQLIIAISKMDSVHWSKDCYIKVKLAIQPFLTKIGYKQDKIRYIPVSGWTGDNLVHKVSSNLCNWWLNNEKTLIELIDNFEIKSLNFQQEPLRFVVSDVYKTMSLGLTLAGKVLNGCVYKHDQLLIMPSNIVIKIKAIQKQHQMINLAVQNDNIELGLGNNIDENVEEALCNGSVLCDIHKPLKLFYTFKAIIMTLSYDEPLFKGSSLVLFTYTSQKPVKIMKIYSYTKSNNIYYKPRYIPANSTAEIILQCNESVCITLFERNKALGRFSLRRKNQTVAVGIINKLYKNKNDQLNISFKSK